MLWDNDILAHPYQPPLSNLKTQVRKNTSLSSANIRIIIGTYSYPPQPETPHQLFPHPPYSSLSCDILQLSNLCLYNRPHPDFGFVMLLHLHPLCNCDNLWAHGGLGVGEDLAIAVTNRDCMVNLFFCVKIHSKKKTEANKNGPGVENQ